MDAFREIRIGRRDALRVTLDIADDDGEWFAVFQRHGTAATQLADADLRAAQVLEQGDDAPGVVGDATHFLDHRCMAVVGAVREIEAKDVDARCDQLANAGIAGRRRSEGRDDLRPSHKK